MPSARPSNTPAAAGAAVCRKHRQRDADTRPDPLVAGHVDRTAAQLDIASRDRQAEPRAGRLGRELRLEHPRQRVGIHARGRCR